MTDPVSDSACRAAERVSNRRGYLWRDSEGAGIGACGVRQAEATYNSLTHLALNPQQALACTPLIRLLQLISAPYF